MIHRGLDTNDDWVFGRGKQSFAQGVDAVMLNIKTRIRSWKGDCFFAPNTGIDWNNYLDIGTKDFLDRDIIRTILQSDGVLKVLEYESEITDRNLDVTATVQTIYGPLQLTEVF